MGYAEDMLNDHETLVADLRPHPLYFWKSVATLIAAVVFGILVMIWFDDGAVGTTMRWLAIGFLLFGVLWVIGRYIGWISTHFILTSDRLVYRSGILHKTGVEIPLERVNTVRFSQRIVERIFGTGDLEIESGATEGVQRFTDIRDPDAVQKLIHKQIDLRSRRRDGVVDGAAMPPPAAPAPVAPADVASQLEKLEGMLERGTLTQAEFDAQKQKLLGA
jgi:membrane protein YdbS with pleckstrin-like domain